MKTLGEFIVEKQHEFSHATGELTALLSAIKLGAKIIHRDINKAGLVDILGASGAENVQGEVQQKLDLFANEKLKAPPPVAEFTPLRTIRHWAFSA